ncbi:hypothetical protein Bca52824_000490 [Brassica carinata]|uniref:Uncharacterized protein n=1 Tax=Brassica carinata TaxID=52824 RepID=A0A8X7WI85_BRACI|nr:hypothetical protein Bca52824_000490 [Brassica carinata]
MKVIKLLPNRLDVGSVWDQTCIHQHQLLYLIITKTKAEQLSQEHKYKIVKKFPELKHVCRMAGYMTLVTIVFFCSAYSTNFFLITFHMRDLRGNEHEMMCAL